MTLKVMHTIGYEEKRQGTTPLRDKIRDKEIRKRPNVTDAWNKQVEVAMSGSYSSQNRQPMVNKGS